MAQYSKSQLEAILSRVADEVTREASAGTAFTVANLREQFADLVKGGEVAWTISYSTSSVALEPGRDVARPGGAVAWTISYSTSSAALGKTTSS